MAKRAAEKARRKAERLEAERIERQRERKQALLVKLAGAFAAAAVLAGIVIAISQGSSSSDKIEGASETERLLSGIPQSGTLLGDPKARVQITEFADLQCPACRQFSESEFPELVERVIRPGKASFEIRQWTILGADSQTAATAAYRAAEVDRYFEFVDLFYRNQGTEGTGYVTEEFLDGILAAASAADAPQPDANELGAELSKTQSRASELGLTGTPSFLVEGPGGEQVVTDNSVAAIEQAVEEVR